MAAEHSYALDVAWTGNRGTGTSGYRDYDREHTVTAPGKPPPRGSADPAFRGDADAWNPEEMLVAAERLHADAHAKCFIARSVAFPVEHHADIVVAGAAR